MKMLSIFREVGLVIEQRQKEYGPPKKNFNDLAKVWSVLLGIEVTPRDVIRCFIAAKLTRDKHQERHDNPVDIIGYGGLMEEVDD